MIRLALLVLASFNLWAYFHGWFPGANLIAALCNVGAAVCVDFVNTAWHRRKRP